MTVSRFVAQWLGRRITSSGGLGGECVDLANEWIAECCGLAHVFRNAIDWAKPDLPHMRWTANTPLNAPTPGALIIWGENAEAGIGPNGHIALVIAADNANFVVAELNYPQGSPTSLGVHDYAGVLGWQTPH